MTLGDLVLVRFPSRKPTGREQEGMRPCLVVTNPDSAGRSRYPCLIIAPLTTTTGAWVANGGVLYPSIDGAALPEPSVVLLDQIQMIDVYRIEKHYGKLSTTELEPIRAGIKALFAEALA